MRWRTRKWSQQNYESRTWNYNDKLRYEVQWVLTLHCKTIKYYWGAKKYKSIKLNLRSPRDYVRPPFVRSRLWYFLSPLDGASRTASRLVQPYEHSSARSALFMKLGSLLYVRCRHRSAKSTAVSNKTFRFQLTNIYLFCGSVTLST